MTRLYILPIILTAVFAAPATASDSVDTTTTTITVGTHDLDLTDPLSQRRLEHRVRSAIEDVCRYPDRDLLTAQRAADCRKLARAGADAQVRFAIAQARLSKARLAAAANGPTA